MALTQTSRPRAAGQGTLRISSFAARQAGPVAGAVVHVTGSGVEMLEAMEVEQQSPLELFASLYEQQNGAPLSPEQTGLLERLIREIWEEEEA